MEQIYITAFHTASGSESVSWNTYQLLKVVEHGSVTKRLQHL